LAENLINYITNEEFKSLTGNALYKNSIKKYRNGFLYEEYKMIIDFIIRKNNITVEKAFEIIKKRGLKKETVYNCYVLSIDRKLLGIIDIKDLLVADRDKLVKDIMENTFKLNVPLKVDIEIGNNWYEAK